MGTLTITTKQGIITINPTYEMGGGIDGYWLEGSTTSGQRISDIIHTPYYPEDPDKEWNVLSEIGRNNIRNEGWKACTQEETIAYAMQTLKFAAEDAERLNQKSETIRGEVKTHFLKAAETFEYDPQWLNNQFSELKTLTKLLNVWKNIDTIIGNHQKIWGNWTPPTEEPTSS